MYEASKRILDIVVASAGLIVAAPLMLLVAILTKLSSEGPVIFAQERSGKDGTPFLIYKFRSMAVHSEAVRLALADHNELAGPVFKIREDPRVTALGRLLRKYSLDELPQLFNVLRGEMSLVGPRPPLPVEVAQYEPWQRGRLAVKPGLTCIWQVSGRSHIHFEEWVRLDLQYIRQRSLWLDLKLLLLTIPAVITGRGAY
jgi:exopolysaccharide biosynthesis polyprenyl glycosylphosphotransferase